MMIPPSYLFPVETLKNGPDRPRRRVQIIVSFWPAAIAGGLAGGAVAWLVASLSA